MPIDREHLAQLYPSLTRHAQLELHKYSLPEQDAGDVVNEAVAIFLESEATMRDPSRASPWLRTCISRLIIHRIRGDHHDPLDQPHLSLDERWARGDEDD